MKKLVTIVLFISIAISLPLFASVYTDKAGNSFSSEEKPTEVDRDFFWAGKDQSFINMEVGSAMLLAGEDFEVVNCTVGSSIRAAGNHVTITSAEVEDNITAAGQYVIVGEDAKMAGAYLAGRVIKFSGEAESLLAAGQTVVLNGRIDGDVSVYAAEVTIGENCVIRGTLNVTAPTEPQTPASAKIGELNYTKESTNSKITVEVRPSTSVLILKAIYSTIGCAIVALLLTIIFPKASVSVSNMLVKRPWQIPLSGFITFLAIVPVSLVLLILGGNGIVLGVALILCLVAACLISLPIFGASLGRIVFPKWNPLLSSLLGGGVVALLSRIPVIRVFVIIASLFCAVGYAIQGWYLARPKQSL